MLTKEQSATLKRETEGTLNDLYFNELYRSPGWLCHASLL